MTKARGFLIFFLAFLVALAPEVAAHDSGLQFSKDYQFFDSDGKPVANGGLCTYNAGTTTGRVLFKDQALTQPHTNPIRLDAGGRVPDAVYAPVGNWKFSLTTAADIGPTLGTSCQSPILTQDNIPGKLDDAAFQTTFARRICETIAVTSVYSAQIADLGKCIEADATGGPVPVNLPSAIDAGNGGMLTVRKSDASGNAVTVTTVAGQTIDGSGSSVQLASKGALLEVVSDGANWKPNNAVGITAGSITTTELDPSVSGRLNKIGELMVFTGTTCPAGYTPAEGQSNLAKADLPELYNLWSNNGAVTAIYGESGENMSAPDTRGVFLRGFNNGKNSGLFDPDATSRTARGDGTAGDAVGTTQDWAIKDHSHTDNTLNSQNTAGTQGGTSVVNFQSGAQTGQVETTAGNVPVPAANISTEIRPSNIQFVLCIFSDPAAAAGAVAPFNTILSGPGAPIAATGNDGDFWISTSNWEISRKDAGAWSVQTNIVGIPGHDYNFDAATADASPDSVRLNDGTSASVTRVYVRNTTAAGVDVSADLATWDDSTTSQNRGMIRITRRGFDGRFWLGRITGATEDGTGPPAYKKFVVEHVASSDATVANIFAAADNLTVTFFRTGDAGNAPGVVYTFSTTTTDPVGSRPGAGEARLNNTDAASATQFFLDNVEAFGNDIRAYLLEWDQSSSTDNRGQLYILQANDPDTFAVYNITGASDTSEPLYMKITVTHVDSKFPGATTTFPNGAPLSIQFIRTGDKGSDGAPGPAGTSPGTHLQFNAVAGVSDPGSGRIKFNNATTASVTRLSVSYANAAAANIESWVLSWDDITNAGSRGIVRVAKRSSPDVDYAVFSVTGASTPTAGSPGWAEIVVTHVNSNGSFTAADDLSVDFYPAGADGAGVPNAFATVISETSQVATGQTITATGSDTYRLNATGGIKATGASANNRTTLELDIVALTGSTLDATDVFVYEETDNTKRKVNANKIAVGKHTIYIPGGAMTPSVTAGAVAATRELASGQPTLPTMNFVHTSNTSAQFSFAFPKGANAGSSITYLVVWTGQAGTAAQTVLWRLACLARANDEPLGTAFGTAANSNDAYIAANDQHDSPESAAVSVAGTLAAEKMVYCRLLRDTADTLEQTVEVIGVKVFYTTAANTDD